VRAPDPDRTGTIHASARRDITAACIGNAVEWYDFAIFGALATTVGTVFFPAQESSTRLVAAFAVYAIAFLARPLGAIYLGRRADREGRRWALMFSVLLMTAGTAAIGLLPGYAALGLLAPAALVTLRAAQGFGAGGELGVAAVFIVEHAPQVRRGAYGAWHTATLALGTAGGFAIGAALTWIATTDVLPRDWWRIGFLLALPLGLVGLYLRQRVRETPAFATLPPHSRDTTPLHTVWRDSRRALVTGFALISAGAVAFNTFFVFVPNHLASTHAVALPSALGVAVLGLLTGGCAALVWGRLSDRVGRRPVALTASTVLAILAIPLAVAADRGGLLGLTVAVLLMGVVVGAMLSMALVAEMFAARIRATGMALTVGLASAIVGGTAPLVEQLMVGWTGMVGPGLYVAAAATLAAVALRNWPETAFAPLP